MKAAKPATPITRASTLKLITETYEKLDMEVTHLERLAGVNKDTVRDFERGKTHIMRADKLQKVLNALGYDLVITKL